MGSVGVVHPGIKGKGGAESVCLHSIEALQDEHEITLYTNIYPDFDGLNEYFGTSVSEESLTVQSPSRLGSQIESLTSNRVGLLRRALLNRAVKHRSKNHDLMMSTKNEVALPGKTIQYIHYPFMYREGADSVSPSLSRSVYDVACRVLSGVDRQILSSNSCYVLTNSLWTSKVVQKTYDVEPEVVYPPVKSIYRGKHTWSEREDGFVSVGRFEQSKNTLLAIDVLRRLVDDGFDVHLHLVGSSLDNEYSRQVERAAESNDFVHIEGSVSREKLKRLLQTHKYGIHTKPFEHFGIVVAEMVSAGMIPFVPHQGGQVEIIDSDSRISYDPQSDVAGVISKVLSDERLQREIRSELPCVDERFGTERFKQQIQSIVESVL